MHSLINVIQYKNRGLSFFWRTFLIEVREIVILFSHHLERLISFSDTILAVVARPLRSLNVLNFGLDSYSFVIYWDLGTDWVCTI